MGRIRLKTIAVVFLVSTATPSGPALCWRSFPPHHMSQGYRRPFLRHDRPLILPGETINPNYFIPETPGGGPLAPEFLPPPYQSQTSPEPSISSGTPSLPQGMAITVNKVLSEKFELDGKGSSPPISRPAQAAQELANCWTPPVPPRGDTVEVTIRFSFDKSGAVLGLPRITYLKAAEGSSAEIVRQSIFAAVKACTPLHFSNSMAANMPGYPLSVRFIGRRAEEPGEHQ